MNVETEKTCAISDLTLYIHVWYTTNWTQKTCAILHCWGAVGGKQLLLIIHMSGYLCTLFQKCSIWLSDSNFSYISRSLAWTWSTAQGRRSHCALLNRINIFIGWRHVSIVYKLRELGKSPFQPRTLLQGFWLRGPAVSAGSIHGQKAFQCAAVTGLDWRLKVLGLRIASSSSSMSGKVIIKPNKKRHT